MPDIILFASGTLGDHLPYIALGQALSARGHRVRLVFNQAMHAYAQRAGLEVVTVSDIERGPEEARENAWAWDHWNYPRPGFQPKAKTFQAEVYVTQVWELIGACQGADLLIATSIRPHGYSAANALGIPWLTASLNPFIFWLPLDASERQAMLEGRRNEYERMTGLMKFTFEALGVDKGAPPWSPGWLFARHILLASSPHFSLPYLDQLQPLSSLDLTGFWFYQDPDWETWEPDESLRRFCEPEDPEQRPIALTFSSQPLENPGEILAKHVLAAQRLRRPLLIQRGWADFSEADLPSGSDPDMVMFAGYLPHDWLFARAACTIQHGGIGSIARALRQGCPMLIVPFGNDQFYNATRVVDLGVGATVHPFVTTADELAQTLREKVLAPETRQRAEALGAKIRAEDGLAKACEYIERYLGRLSSQGEHPAIYERFAPPLTPRRERPTVETLKERQTTQQGEGEGTWRRPSEGNKEREVKVTLVQNGRALSMGVMEIDLSVGAFREAEKPPCISCLMVTGGERAFHRIPLAQRAVSNFMGQSYPNKELVIVDDGQDETLERWIGDQYAEALDEGQIVYIRLPAENKTLGELRNLAVERASGDYVAQWDDDDLSDPQRLEIQMAAIHTLRTEACMLERHQIWWPASRRMALSTYRIWESSFLCAKRIVPTYPHKRKGEDTPVIVKILQEGRVALLDYPQLYTYVFHGANTFHEPEHWEIHWREASESYEGEMYEIKVREMEARLKLDLSPWIDGEGSDGEMPSYPRPAAPAAAEDPHQTSHTAPTPTITRAAADEGTCEQNLTASGEDKILILVPVKDAVQYLSRLWENLKTLSYPHELISLGFLESDSADGTYEFIAKNLPILRAEFARAKLYKRDYDYRSDLPRWEESEQFQRRSILAKSRNYLLARALEDEDWVLWIDVDVAHWPRDVIERLLAAGKEIVAPNCLGEQRGEPFDTNTYKLKSGAEQLDWSPYFIDGILQPPKGYERFYLSDLRQHECIEVDGVGATMLLVRADLHREGLIFPTFSYRNHIETEGLVYMARDMGYRCWGLPNLEIFHPD